MSRVRLQAQPPLPFAEWERLTAADFDRLDNAGAEHTVNALSVSIFDESSHLRVRGSGTAVVTNRYQIAKWNVSSWTDNEYTVEAEFGKFQNLAASTEIRQAVLAEVVDQDNYFGVQAYVPDGASAGDVFLSIIRQQSGFRLALLDMNAQAILAGLDMEAGGFRLGIGISRETITAGLQTRIDLLVGGTSIAHVLNNFLPASRGAGVMVESTHASANYELQMKRFRVQAGNQGLDRWVA